MQTALNLAKTLVLTQSGEDAIGFRLVIGTDDTAARRREA
jgi:hypothetical protein